MYSILFDYIKKYTTKPLTEGQRTLMEKAFIPFKLRKKQYFLQAGNQCRHFAFITKGAMRQYTVDDNGLEHIARLGIEEWWMGDRESYLTSSATKYNIDAWEDTEMLIITNDYMQEIMKIPAFNEVLRKLDDNNNIANQRRITSAISLSAEMRYLELEDSYPQMIARFPQHIIASYLGITKDTLSRIKRNRLK